MKLKKLTLEERINNIENRIRKLESVLMREREREMINDVRCLMISKERSTKMTKVTKIN